MHLPNFCPGSLFSIKFRRHNTLQKATCLLNQEKNKMLSFMFYYFIMTIHDLVPIHGLCLRNYMKYRHQTRLHFLLLREFVVVLVHYSTCHSHHIMEIHHLLNLAPTRKNLEKLQCTSVCRFASVREAWLWRETYGPRQGFIKAHYQEISEKVMLGSRLRCVPGSAPFFLVSSGVEIHRHVLERLMDQFVWFIQSDQQASLVLFVHDQSLPIPVGTEWLYVPGLCRYSSV